MVDSPPIKAGKMVLFGLMSCKISCHKTRIGLAAALSLLLALTTPACGIKTEVKVPVSPRIIAAKNATLQELLAKLSEYSDKITSLSSSSVKVSLTTGKPEGGKLQEYRSAPGYVLLRRPHGMLLTIQNPLTKTTILELLSRGDEFEIWNPRDNRLYIGRNSARELEFEEKGQGLSFTARPIHILDAVLPTWILLDQPDRRILRTEEQDDDGKYYVLTQVHDGGGMELRALRRLWVERSQLAVVKEETFTEAGEVAGIVHYANLSESDGVLLPLSIQIERPLDGYKLELQFRSWRVNPALPDSSFALKPPQSAERIVLKEKVRSQNR
jgi:outer membrane lipoprotein-sorting protein